MTTTIFDKTDKAREEIAKRSNQLPSRLRTLLVLTDGKTPADALLKKVAGLGLDEESLATLEREGYITPVAGSTPDQEVSGTTETASATAIEEPGDGQSTEPMNSAGATDVNRFDSDQNISTDVPPDAGDAER